MEVFGYRGERGAYRAQDVAFLHQDKLYLPSILPPHGKAILQWVLQNNLLVVCWGLAHGSAQPIVRLAVHRNIQTNWAHINYLLTVPEVVSLFKLQMVHGRHVVNQSYHYAVLPGILGINASSLPALHFIRKVQ